MQLNGKPTDLSALVSLLFLPLGLSSGCSLIIGLWGAVSLAMDWNRFDVRDAVAVGMFLALGTFGVLVAVSWYRRLYNGQNRKQTLL